MNESFLWYVWKYRLFPHDLFTTDGEPVIVEYPGQQNNDSGPDFSHARVRIGSTLWAGNVEVHVHSGDWLKHGHQHDKAFDNVILHVVYINDATISRPGGQEIPVVELKDNIDQQMWDGYRRLMKSNKKLPCSGLIEDVNPLIIQQWLDRILVSRLERKTKYIEQLLKLYRGNREEVFYQLLASNYGFKVNALPFELLSRSIDYKTLIRHSSGLLQMEALLFGQAGLLEENFDDPYPNQLKKEYIYLKQKLNLQPLEKKLWKFSRMRPANFPTIRISQFVNLMHSSPHFAGSVIEEESLERIRQRFKTKAGNYWDVHFTFDHPSAYAEKNMGDAAIDNIIINTIVPFLFSYGKAKGEEQLCSKAINWLENVAPENNTIIRNWTKTGIAAPTAYYSQALIELNNEYCIKKNCLNCGIGVKLLQQKKT
ncbi:MAG: DUF2851 family protein [Bacteroidota bacterium]